MEWVIAAVSLITALGIGKLLAMAYKASQDRKAVKRALDETTSGKAIDADVNAFNSISKRLELVELRLDSVHAQLMDQKVENAKLEAENSRLAKENERQEKEIERQRGRLHDFADKLQEKDAHVLALTVELKDRHNEISQLRSEMDQLKRQVNAMSPQSEGHTNGDEFTQE